MAVSQSATPKCARPSAAQRAYLVRGLYQAGGKLPLFDENGQRYSERTIRSCIEHGWAEPWFENPLKPDWTVCRLTQAGYAALTPEKSAGTGKAVRAKPENLELTH